MRYTSHLTKGAFILALSMCSLAACNRDKKDSTSTLTNADDNGGYASDNAKMQRNGDDVISIADAAASTSNGANLRTTATTGTTIGSCATVTNDTTASPHVLTIDFGTADCICADDRKRRGKIIVTYSGHYKDSGSVHTITYNDYYIQDEQLTGSKSVTNNGTNSSGQVYYTVVVNDTLHTTAGNIEWAGTRTRTWLAGYSTAIRSDDQYSITGTTSLTRASGNTFVMDITSPLIIALDCDYIEKGTISITGPGGGVRTLDYGDGTCDNIATLTIGSHTYTITLH